VEIVSRLRSTLSGDHLEPKFVVLPDAVLNSESRGLVKRYAALLDEF
jgi:hypothetical protein